MAENPNDEPCPFCNGKPSSITGGGCYSTTLVDYSGGPDMNRRTYRLSCTRGHRWGLVRQHGKPDVITRIH